MGDEDTKEKLERLRAIRRANRGVITKKISDANAILGIGGTLSNEQEAQLDVINRLLENKLKIVEDLDQNILSLCDVEAIQGEIEDSEKVLERVVACQKRIHDALQKLTNESNTPQGQAVAGLNPFPQMPLIEAKAKLPKLTLPKFRGDITKWISFWDSFKSAVHENGPLSAIDKFNYLNSLLEGHASRAIQGLSLTEANYESAIEILNERFGRKQQIISAHMDELLKLPNCLGTERSTSLRNVYDKISVHVRGLASLGVSSEQYGGLLIPVIMAKLPGEVRVRIARETKSSVWQIEGLLETIKEEVEAREISESVRITEDRNPKPSMYPNKPPRYSTANSLVTRNDFTTRRPPQLRCVYCSGPHYSASCERVTSPSDRRNALIDSKRCFKCLSTEHKLKECKVQRNCRNCGGRHHQSICLAGFRETRPIDQNYTQNDETAGMGSTTTQLTTTTTSSTKVKGDVLLQTATTIATNHDRSKSVPVRILFDNGSQRSYVTDSLKSKLGLSSTSSETLHLNTFGENAYRKQRCQVVTLPLKTKTDEFVEISALNFLVICSPLTKRVNIDRYPHLRYLELADHSEPGEESIDILIGSDYYWDLVTNEIIQGEFGPTAINSKFGWLISGPTNVRNTRHDNTTASNLVISGEPFFDEAREGDEITDMLKKFWETDSIGIIENIDPTSQMPFSVKRNEEISFDGQHYEVALPWKEDCLPSSNNYGMCESRLRSLHQKLKAKPELLSEYDNIIKEQEQNGIVERAPVKNIENDLEAKRVHYSPHHAVVRKDRETTKVRVVYDGSAKSSKQDRSLNDCLEVGDNYIPLIFDMLLKFRWNTVGLTADIEKAFLMSAYKSKTATCCDSFGLMSRSLQDQQLLNIDLTGLFSVCDPHPQFLAQPFHTI